MGFTATSAALTVHMSAMIASMQILVISKAMTIANAVVGLGVKAMQAYAIGRAAEVVCG